VLFRSGGHAMNDKVLLINKVSPVCGDLLKEQGFNVDIGGNPNEQELVKLAPEYACIALRGASSITAPVLEAGIKGKLRMVVRVGAGVNNIDVAAATRLGVIVCNTPGTNARGVVELTIAALLAMARNIIEANNSLKAGKWEKNKFVGTELLGKTLGVIGLGNIGRGVAGIGRALGMRVLGFDPVFTPDNAKELGIELVTLDTIFAQSDYITLHASLTEGSKNMIGADALAKMKDGVAIANCARAQLVDTNAMLAALKSGKVHYYYTDVFTKEPPEAGDPLVASDRVIVTPHVAGSTEEAEVLGARQAAVEISAFFKENKVVNAVNFFPGDPALAPWEPVAEKMGDFAYQYVVDGKKVSQVSFRYNGTLSAYATERLTAAFFKGFMQNAFENANIVNARQLAREQGLKVVESKMENVRDYIRVACTTDAGEIILRGSQINGKEILHSIDDYFFDIPLKDKYYLVSRHSDVPGIVGIIGTKLGEAGVNIEKFSLEDKSGMPSMAVISTGSQVPQQVMGEIEAAVAGKGGDIALKRITLHSEPTVD
jgi:D-3-phosphoglycerate dehydrogenase / 2-oxoglutarate reductase